MMIFLDWTSCALHLHSYRIIYNRLFNISNSWDTFTRRLILVFLHRKIVRCVWWWCADGFVAECSMTEDDGSGTLMSMCGTDSECTADMTCNCKEGFFTVSGSHVDCQDEHGKQIVSMKMFILWIALYWNESMTYRGEFLPHVQCLILHTKVCSVFVLFCCSASSLQTCFTAFYFSYIQGPMYTSRISFLSILHW